MSRKNGDAAPKQSQDGSFWTPTDELQRLLSAAAINERFRTLLLTDAARALDEGFFGQSFDLSPEERRRVLSIQARTLAEFAARLSTHNGRI